MTQNEFTHILASIPTLSPDQMRRLARELESRLAAPTDPPGQAPANASRIDGGLNSPTDLTEQELTGQELQLRLFNAGLLSEIKPPLRDLTPYRDRKAVPIQGESLSETVIRERR